MSHTRSVQSVEHENSTLEAMLGKHRSVTELVWPSSCTGGGPGRMSGAPRPRTRENAPHCQHAAAWPAVSHPP